MNAVSQHLRLHHGRALALGRVLRHTARRRLSASVAPAEISGAHGIAAAGRARIIPPCDSGLFGANQASGALTTLQGVLERMIAGMAAALPSFCSKGHSFIGRMGIVQFPSFTESQLGTPHMRYRYMRGNLRGRDAGRQCAELASGAGKAS